MRDREQWLAVPVPASGLPRDLVDAARTAIEGNRRPPRSGRRFWELSGMLRCSCCGYMMNTQTTFSSRGKGNVYFYYRCGGRYRNGNGCGHDKSHRADAAEAKVWEYVRDSLANPEELRADLERMIELKREEVRGDPGREAEAWLDRLDEVDRQRSRAQDMAIQGLLGYDELRAKLASLEGAREATARELAVLKDRQEHIAELERDKEAVLENYAAVAPERLNSLAPEERRHIYGMLCA